MCMYVWYVYTYMCILYECMCDICICACDTGVHMHICVCTQVGGVCDTYACMPCVVCMCLNVYYI